MRSIDWAGLTCSKIGMGTGRYGSLVEKETAFCLMDQFLESGGNLIDTARNYYEWVKDGRGRSEKTIGEWMQKRGNRDQVVLSTKAGVWNEGPVFHADLALEHLLEECKESKEALQTDYLDIYLLHRDEPERSVEEIMESLQCLAEESKARLIGVCNWRLERLQAADRYAKQQGLRPIEVVQTWWSIADYTEKMWNDPTTTGMDAAMYDYLLKEEKLVMAYTSQAKGFFQKAIKEGLEALPEKLKERVVTKENLRRLEMIRNFCEEKKISPTAVVNGYITQNDLPGIALISTSKSEQLEEILSQVDVEVDKDWLRQFDIRN